MINQQDKKQRLGYKILRNAFWLTAGDITNRLLKGVLIIYTTRLLPVAEYGAFSFSINLLSLTFIAADLGVGSILQRRLAEKKDDREYLGTSFFLKIILLILAIAVTVVAARMSDPRILSLSLALTLMMAFDAFKGFFLAIHTAQNRMDKVAIANTIETTATVAMGFIILFKFPNALALAWAYNFGAFASLLFVLRTVKSELKGLLSYINKKLMAGMLLAAWPLALGGVVWGLMNTTDSLILGWLRGLELVAFYNAAAKIPQLLGPIGGIIIGATFPSLVATRKDPETHKKLFQRINELLFSITIPIAVGGIIVANPLIETLYGASYMPSAFILGFLLLNLVQTAISFFLTQLIFVHNHQAKSLAYISLAWVMNISLSLAIIPAYGMIGAAVASLISQSLIFISHVLFVKKHYGLNVFSKELLKPVLAALVMGTALAALKASSISVFFSIPFGAAIYGLILFTLRPKILGDLKSLFRGARFEPPREQTNI